MSGFLASICHSAHQMRGQRRVLLGEYKDFVFEVREYYLYLQQFQADTNVVHRGLEVALPIGPGLTPDAIEAMMRTARTHLQPQQVIRTQPLRVSSTDSTTSLFS